MLEELVENERTPPAETALLMMSFLQTELPAGGTAAERRFIRLFAPLCDRIFGKILGEKESYRHKDGGWLSAQRQWPRSIAAPMPPSSNQPPLGQQVRLTSLSSIKNKPSEEDPVLTLLGTAGKVRAGEVPPPTLIEAIAKDSENRPEVWYKFPFLGLPKSTQEIWLAVLETSLGGKPAHTVCTENGMRLFGDLLRQRPSDQADLQRYRLRATHQNEQLPGIRLSPRGLKTTRQPSFTKESNEDASSSPVVMLSMLEYYLFLFVRYPTAAPIPKASASRSQAPYSPGLPQEPYGELLYLEVFKRMLSYFLPYEQEEGRCISFDNRFRQSELCLRVIIALWVETQTQMDPTTEILRVIQERKSLAGIVEPPSFDLDSSYELVQARYNPPVAQVQKCLRALMIRIFVDPSLSKNVHDKDRRDWCLGPAQTALQPFFYNQVRATFRYASIHFPSSPFFATFNLWLIWLEPWNISTSTKSDFSARHATQRIMKQGNGSRVPSRSLMIPSYNQKSKYTSDWEPYIAANLFMYTVPLAIFLRRARELDFSPAKFDASVQLVKRVFRVFSPDVVSILSRLLPGANSNLNHPVSRHMEILGVYAPPLGTMTMSSYKTDMHNLLDEIHMQHKKTKQEQNAFDRIVGKVEGWFGQGVLSREEKALDSLLESARLIAQLPLDYKISPGDGPLSSAESLSSGDRAPDRTADGVLSSTGQAQIFNGLVKCNPADVEFRGDKMRMASVGTYEVAFLVELMIFLSDWLNAKLGISPHDTDAFFRFNLRFLADYRNLLFTVVSTYIAFKLLWRLFW